MARKHKQLTDRGAEIAAVSCDPLERNAALVAKLHLPFPILSDPDFEQAIRPLGLLDERYNQPPVLVEQRLQVGRPGPLAFPADRVVAPDGRVVHSHTAPDYTFQPELEPILAALDELGLPAIDPMPNPVGRIDPERFWPFSLTNLLFHFRSVKYNSMALRHHMVDEADRAECERNARMCDSYEAAFIATLEMERRNTTIGML
jgi:peroxiredoxin